MMPSHWIECPRGQSFQAPFTGVAYRCTGCDGLLDADESLKGLSPRTPQAWKSLFAERAVAKQGAYASGVWSKHELVDRRIDLGNIVSLGEGNTPLLSDLRLAEAVDVAGLYIKQYGMDRTSSYDALGMSVLASTVSQMVANGATIDSLALLIGSVSEPIRSAVDYCSTLGVGLIAFAPSRGTESASFDQLEKSGARVFMLDADEHDCAFVAREALRDLPVYLAEEAESLYLGGEKTAVMELLQQMEWSVPDWIVIPYATARQARAVGRGLLVMHAIGLVERLPRLALVYEQEHAQFPEHSCSHENCLSFAQAHTKDGPILSGPVHQESACKFLCALDGLIVSTGGEEGFKVDAIASDLSLSRDALTALGVVLRLRGEQVIGRSESVAILARAEASAGDRSGQTGGVPWAMYADRKVDSPLPPDPAAVRERVLRELQEI